MRKKVFIGLVVTAVFCAVGFSVKSVEFYRIVADLDQQIMDINKEIEVEQNKLEELQEEAEKIQSLDYIEKMAREKLGMVKEHDVVFKLK